MSEWIDSNRIGPVTINGSGTAISPGTGNPTGTSTNLVFDVRGLGTAAVQTITTSSLAYKIYVSTDGGTTWSPVRTANSAGAATAADTAITASATVTDYVPVATATHMRVTRTAGSGTISFAGHPDPEVFQSSSAATSTVDTELPAAAALADATANPTVPGVGGFGHMFNGTTWDRLRGSIVGGLQVGHGKTLKTYSGTFSSDTDVIAAVTSKRIKVYAYSIINTANTADTVIFKSNGTGGTELWRVYLRGPDANTPYGANLATSPPGFLFATVAGEKLTVDVSDTATLHVSIAYFDDDAT